MRAPVLTLVLLTGCGPDALAWREPRALPVFPDLPEALVFPETTLGDEHGTAVTVANLGQASGAWVLDTQGPFTVDRGSVELGAGQQLTLELTFRPVGYAPSTGQLRLVGAGALSLSGTTRADGDGDGDPAVAAGGGDCDDADASVYPGASEVCGDGVDQDCDPGGEIDCDGDGAPAPADCDDADPAVGPGRADDAEDGVDDDCDGLVDEGLLAFGDLVITEMSPQDPAWIELCSTDDRAIDLGGLTVRTGAGAVTLPTGTVEPGGCAAICASSIADCAFQADLVLGGAADTLVVAAGDQPLDALAWDERFGWIPGHVLALDPAYLDADANNTPGAWCVTNGTPGEPNAACAEGVTEG